MDGCGLFRFFCKKLLHRDKEMEDHRELVEGQTTPGKQVDSKPGFRIENGRRYHNRDDVAYILPNDDIENDRIHLQHWLLKSVYNGNFNAPVNDKLEKGILVHDAGCGPGTWTLEMAKSYPLSTFYGTDISARFPEAIKPENCRFNVHNLLDTKVFPEDHFGFIHQRLLLAGFLKNDWNKAILEHVRTLAPGGWLECLEFGLYQTQNVGPKYQVLINAFHGMCEARGLFWDVIGHLEDMLRNAGLVNIDHKEGEGALDDKTQIGRLWCEDFRESFMALKPVVTRILPHLDTDESYQTYLEEVRQECIELNTRTVVYRIWGQKQPLDAEEESKEM